MITALRLCRNREESVPTTRRAPVLRTENHHAAVPSHGSDRKHLGKRKWTPQRQADTGLTAATHSRKRQYCGPRRRPFHQRPRHPRLRRAYIGNRENPTYTRGKGL